MQEARGTISRAKESCTTLSTRVSNRRGIPCQTHLPNHHIVSHGSYVASHPPSYHPPTPLHVPPYSTIPHNTISTPPLTPYRPTTTLHPSTSPRRLTYSNNALISSVPHDSLNPLTPFPKEPAYSSNLAYIASGLPASTSCPSPRGGERGGDGRPVCDGGGDVGMDESVRRSSGGRRRRVVIWVCQLCSVLRDGCGDGSGERGARSGRMIV